MVGSFYSAEESLIGSGIQMPLEWCGILGNLQLNLRTREKKIMRYTNCGNRRSGTTGEIWRVMKTIGARHLGLMSMTNENYNQIGNSQSLCLFSSFFCDLHHTLTSCSYQISHYMLSNRKEIPRKINRDCIRRNPTYRHSHLCSPTSSIASSQKCRCPHQFVRGNTGRGKLPPLRPHSS